MYSQGTHSNDFLRALLGRPARELMTPNPVSLRDSATPFEAAEFFNKNHVSAAPVIDEAGKPVGVISLSDLVWYQRTRGANFESPHEFYAAIGAAPSSTESKHRPIVHIRDIMTPAIFSVSPQTTIQDVVQEMFASKVHRLFVVDQTDALIGTISAFDVVRALAS